MRIYAINERIYFDMEIIRARWLYRKDRKMRTKIFNRHMKKIRNDIDREMFLKIERKFKRCGRGRP